MRKENQVPPREEIEYNTSLKDFPNVLGKIGLNIPYTIDELEFEFYLSWDKLKPLLDEHSQYEIEGNKITILSRRPKQPDFTANDFDVENQNYKEHLTELENFFYKMHKHGKMVYGRVCLKKKALEFLNPKLKDALLFGEKSGLVIATENQIDDTITFRLHAYYRPKSHRRN